MKYTEERTGIKLWAEEDRPREKVLLKGKESLSPVELIAILIGSGNVNESAVDLAKRILLGVNNDLNELGKLTVEDLLKYKGIGNAKAVSIIAALELGRRKQIFEVKEKQKITSARDVFEMLQPSLTDLPHEEFWLLLLNRSNRVIKQIKVSSGGVSGTVVDQKMIFKYAIDNLASSIIICHNHPSGNKQPSKADIELTKKMKKAGDMLDIPVLDHVIITTGEYLSMAEEGYL
ncbi:MAG: DNA repair protein RadC [Bacteroidetes bacterium]|nr:DNA repair protein RadC [Bacteroidota bacterium]